MSRMRRYFLACGLLCVVVVMSPMQSVHAASPWWTDEAGSGVPYTWAGGQITYVTDSGGIGPFSNAEIIQKIQQAFAVWTSAGLYQSGSLASGKPIPTVNLLAMGTAAGQKITADNLAAYVQKGPVILFDADGSFIKALGIDPNGVRAITIFDQDTPRDPKTLHLLSGKTVLNGLYLKDAKGKDEKTDPTVGKFMAALIHEMGHLFNLDHSGLNAAQAAEIFADLPHHANELPTMYPIVDDPEQMTLHWDDVVAISNLYPRPEFTTQFCTIAGTVIGNDGHGYQGAQVIARSVQDQMTVAVSAISGNYFPQGAADGSYILRGILPGKLYGVTYEELPASFVAWSSIQPYGDDAGETPRSGFGSGLITAGNGKAKAGQCLKAGETVLMDTVQFAIPSGATWQPQVQLVPSTNQPIVTADGKPLQPSTGTGGTPSPSESSSSGGGSSCSLIVR